MKVRLGSVYAHTFRQHIGIKQNHSFSPIPLSTNQEPDGARNGQAKKDRVPRPPRNVDGFGFQVPLSCLACGQHPAENTPCLFFHEAAEAMHSSAQPQISFDGLIQITNSQNSHVSFPPVKKRIHCNHNKQCNQKKQEACYKKENGDGKIRFIFCHIPIVSLGDPGSGFFSTLSCMLPPRLH